MKDLVRQNVTLEKFDDRIVRNFAEPKGLSFSAALRLIIREWHMYNQLHSETPAQRIVEDLRQGM